MELSLLKTLKGIDSVAIDTSPFIYYIEEHKDYIRVIDPLFNLMGQSKIIAYTSVVTLIEVLTRPIEENNNELVATYEKLLTSSENLILVDIDKQMGVESAKLRAKYNIRTPDAIQLAAGLVNGAKVFITNDANLKKIKEIKVVILDDFIQ